MVKKTSVRKHVAPRASRPHAPGYGLPTTSKGLLPWKWAADRLTKSREYWIATNEFCFSTGGQSRKASNLKANPKCVICNEDAEEAVIVEGIAKRMRDVPLIRKFLSIYGRKYKFDMSGMAGDMLSLKEPIFVVAPRKVFGLAEKTFATRATRWKFGK